MFEKGKILQKNKKTILSSYLIETLTVSGSISYYFFIPLFFKKI